MSRKSLKVQRERLEAGMADMKIRLDRRGECDGEQDDLYVDWNGWRMRKGREAK